MKLPNGYGTVYKLPGKRRRPFVVRKTVGWSDEGKQIVSTIGYYSTRAEALQALAEYNNDPFDLIASKLTFSQVYDKWMEDTFDYDSSPSTVKNYTRAYKCCDALYGMRTVDIVLMMIYSGVRINELLNLKKEDVNLDKQYFYVRASKTNAGVRIVPIADKVLPLWVKALERSTCDYAVSTGSGEKLDYDNFRKNYWHPLMKDLGMDYIPQETRHTCNSLLIMSNCNPTIRKKIIGHTSQMDLGEAVYGHIYNEELLAAINKI